jgi:hypothetical protein
MKILVTSPIGIKGVHTPAGSVVELPDNLAREIIHSGTALEHLESEIVKTEVSEVETVQDSKGLRKKG